MVRARRRLAGVDDTPGAGDLEESDDELVLDVELPGVSNDEDNGVLTLRLPKAESARRRRIEVR